ncbi:MAG TPA: hypothetical protein VG815_17090 [Chloroflexota bacterium]|nr:hypothetical protein [Chloroflexota bacterium]
MKCRFRTATAPIIFGVALLFVLSPYSAGARSRTIPAGQVHHATLTVKPRCFTVGPRRKDMRITLVHGVQHTRYTFALLPLFGNGVFRSPNMGLYQANHAGMIRFLFRAPRTRHDIGRWQVTATRKVGFKLAAVTRFDVKRGKCKH